MTETYKEKHRHLIMLASCKIKTTRKFNKIQLQIHKLVIVQEFQVVSPQCMHLDTQTQIGIEFWKLSKQENSIQRIFHD